MALAHRRRDAHLPLAGQSSPLVLSLWAWLDIGKPPSADDPSWPQEWIAAPNRSGGPA